MLLFIAHLLTVSLILLFLFRAYGHIFGRFLKPLDNLPGGAILFLAINEIIAVPFIFFHLGYAHYIKVFIALNVAVLLVGIRRYQHIIPRLRFTISPKNIFLVCSLVLLGITFVLSQTHSYYSADDSTYVSLAQQSQSNQDLYLIDPATGSSDRNLSAAYTFQGWELMQGALSDLSGLHTTEFVRGVIPLVMLTTVFFLFMLIFQHMVKSSNAYLALFFAQLMFLYGAFSTRAQPSFFMTRQWQGKALLSLFIIPLLSFMLYKTYQLPKKSSILPLAAVIFVINIAAQSLNPTSTYLCASLVGVFSLIIFYKRRSFKDLVLMGLTIVPFIPLTVVRLIKTGSGGSGRLDLKSFSEYFVEYIGHPGFFILLAIGLVVFYSAKSMKAHRVFHYVFPAVLFATVLNPLLQSTVGSNVTSTTYWRLFWLLPLFITLPILGVELYEVLQDRLKRFASIGKVYRSALSVTLVVLLIALSGRFIYAGHLDSLAHNTTRYKLPPGVVDVARYMKGLPDGNILAASDPAIYLHNYTSKHVIIAPRELDVRVRYEKGSYEYVTRMQLATIMDKRGDDFFSTERYHFELTRIGVDYVIYELDNVFVHQYIRDYQTIPLYENDIFGVFEVVDQLAED